MKIKKHGKLFKGSTEKDKYEQFKCENCGCEFSVKEDEYYRVDSLTTITITSNYSYSPTDTLVCSCPECYKICKKYDYKAVTYDTTLNSTSSSATTPLNMLNRSTAVDASNEVN